MSLWHRFTSAAYQAAGYGLRKYGVAEEVMAKCNCGQDKMFGLCPVCTRPGPPLQIPGVRAGLKILDESQSCTCGSIQNDCIWHPRTQPPVKRTFPTGATRDASAHKLSFLRHLSPTVLRRFTQYMHDNMEQADGTTRAPDNWKLGMPKEEFAESLLRHVWEFWEMVEPGVNEQKPLDVELVEKLLCAILFNAQGYLHELLREESGE